MLPDAAAIWTGVAFCEFLIFISMPWSSKNCMMSNVFNAAAAWRRDASCESFRLISIPCFINACNISRLFCSIARNALDLPKIELARFSISSNISLVKASGLLCIWLKSAFHRCTLLRRKGSCCFLSIILGPNSLYFLISDKETHSVVNKSLIRSLKTLRI